MKHYWLVLEVMLSERVKQKLETSQDFGYVLLQRYTDGNHFKKKVYLSRRKADLDGYLPMKGYSTNILYDHFFVKPNENDLHRNKSNKFIGNPQDE